MTELNLCEWGFARGSVVRNPPVNAGDAGSILSGEDPLEKDMAAHSSALLETPMDRGAWWAAVYGIAKSRTRLTEHTPM